MADFLESVGYALETPGALLRGLLAGRPGKRLTGEELLQIWGLIRPNDPERWELRDLLGPAATGLTDALVWGLLGGLVSGLRGGGVLAKAARAVRGVKEPLGVPFRLPSRLAAKLAAEAAPAGPLPRPFSLMIPAYRPSLRSRPYWFESAWDDPLKRLVLYEGKEVGETNLGPLAADVAARAAKVFPTVVKQGQPVRYLHGIFLEPAYRGKGIGQEMFLDALGQEPAAWLFGNQMELPAIRALGKLVRKGLAEGYERYGLDPTAPLKFSEFANITNPFIVRITPKGLEALRRLY